MRYRLIRVLPVLLTMLTSAASLGGQSAWIQVEQGKALYEQRDLTGALSILQSTVEEHPDYPEAEFWLGKVYESQGQPVLAAEQYRRAIDLSLYLRVPDDRVEYQYALAGLLMNRGVEERREAETILIGLAEEEGYSSPGSIGLEHRYMKHVVEDGLDELVFLYRDELSRSLQARRMLSELAWAEGRYRSSLVDSTRVVLSLLTTATLRYRASVGDWRFDIDPELDPVNPDRDDRFPGDTDGVEDLLERVNREDPPLAEWLTAQGLWSQFYLLANSMYAEGHPGAARSIWLLLAPPDPLDGTFTPLAEAGRWGRLAAAQLVEPVISIGSLSP